MRGVLKCAPWAVVVIMAFWSLFPRQNLNNAGQQEAQLAFHWDQPKLLDNQYPQPIYQGNWDFDFSPIENQLSKLPMDTQQHIQLDEATLISLEKTFERLPEKADTPTLQRIDYLISKSLPSPAGEEFAQLMQSYRSYHKAQQELDVLIEDSKRLESARKKLKASIDIQNQHFGAATAEQLFKQRRLLSEYLLNRRGILENNQLNREQKNQKLKILRKQFQSHNSNE